MPRRGHRRLRIALVAILCLLFQQVAIAAYVCTMPNMPPDPVNMAEDCTQVGMHLVQEAPAICTRHCAPDLAVATDHVPPSVPALALPPVEFARALAVPTSCGVRSVQVPIERSDPPPRLRYCSLLI